MPTQDRIFVVTDRPRPYVAKDRAYTFTAQAFLNGTQEVPSAATITIRQPGGAALTTAVSAAAMTVAGGGDMTYALVAGNTATLGANYIADVAYTVSSVVYDARFLFDVVRAPYRNVVVTADLALHHVDLTDYLNSSESSSAQTYIEQAGEDVAQFLHNKGRREYLVLDMGDLRRPIEYLALSKIFFAKSKNEGDKFDRWFKHYLSAYEGALAAINLVYDEDDSGTADGTSETDSESGEDGTRFGARIHV